MGWHVSPQSAYADHHGGIWRMSSHHPSKSHTQRERGFSLIDVAVVMAIVGILLAGFLATYKMYQATRATTITEENFIAAQEALGAFIPFKDNRYPVPSPFGLTEEDALYGLEGDVAAAATCTNEASARGKICLGKANIGGTEYDVLIGALPFADLNMPDTQARDGYGRMFTYAVTRALTVPNGAEPTFTTVDTNGDSVVDEKDDLPPPVYKHYVCVKTQDLEDNGSIAVGACEPRAMVLISHGSDGIGAWLPSGKMYMPCRPDNEGTQNDNCDFDGEFIQSMRRTQIEGQSTATTADDVYIRQPMLVRGDGADKNDDSIQVEVREDGNYWASISADNKVQNNHNYRVGIGVAEPEKPLEVNGNVMADKGVLAEELCIGGANCLKVSTLAGEEAAMNCGRMGLVAGIKNNAAECVKAVTYNTTCGPDQMVAGFDGFGNPICRTLTKPTCGPAHGKVASEEPPVAQRCTKGTVQAFSGSGPWSWQCNLDGKIANCATVATEPPEEPPPACIDECGETRFDGSTWCRAGSYRGRSRCSGTSVVDEGCISGIGCCGAGTRMCP